MSYKLKHLYDEFVAAYSIWEQAPVRRDLPCTATLVSESATLEKAAIAREPHWMKYISARDAYLRALYYGFSADN